MPSLSLSIVWLIVKEAARWPSLPNGPRPSRVIRPFSPTPSPSTTRWRRCTRAPPEGIEHRIGGGGRSFCPSPAAKPERQRSRPIFSRLSTSGLGLGRVKTRHRSRDVKYSSKQEAKYTIKQHKTSQSRALLEYYSSVAARDGVFTRPRSKAATILGRRECPLPTPACSKAARSLAASSGHGCSAPIAAGPAQCRGSRKRTPCRRGAFGDHGWIADVHQTEWNIPN
jgi:hypothetical protein